MSAPIFLVALTIGLACGCERQRATPAPSEPAPQPPVNPPATQMTTLTGTLRGGMMAIGGETSGWTLVGDGAVGGIELDVSKVKDDAKRLDGKRVSVSGRMIDRKYVERGTVRVMQVEKIAEAR